MPSRSTKNRSLPSLKLAGQTVAFVGQFPFHPGHQTGERLVVAEGGQVAAEVSPAVNLLVLGYTRARGPSGAEKKAQRINQQGTGSIRIVYAGDFLQLCAPSRDELLALILGGRAGVARWEALRECGISMGHPSWIPPDMRGADFRGMRHDACEDGPLSFLRLELEDADFSGAELRGVEFNLLRRVNFDRATVSGIIRGFRECSARQAHLPARMTGIQLEASDFSGAQMADAELYGVKAARTIWHSTDLSRAKLRNAQLAAADFSRVEAPAAHFDLTDLSGARFIKANLRGADFTDANLQGADLSGADLRGANFSHANLTDAIVAGANFQAANFRGAVLTNVDTSRAKHIDSIEVGSRGQVGSHLRELESVAAQSDLLNMTLRFVAARTRTILHLRHVLYKYTGVRYTEIQENGMDGARQRYTSSTGPLAKAMLRCADRFGNAVLEIDSITVKSRRAPVVGRKLKDLVIGAWCEACGM